MLAQSRRRKIPDWGSCVDIATNIRDDGEPICSYYRSKGWCEKYEHVRDGGKFTCRVCVPTVEDDFSLPGIVNHAVHTIAAP
jgi:hypothetical protein